MAALVLNASLGRPLEGKHTPLEVDARKRLLTCLQSFWIVPNRQPCREYQLCEVQTPQCLYTSDHFPVYYFVVFPVTHGTSCPQRASHYKELFWYCMFAILSTQSMNANIAHTHTPSLVRFHIFSCGIFPSKNHTSIKQKTLWMWHFSPQARSSLHLTVQSWQHPVLLINPQHQSSAAEPWGFSGWDFNLPPQISRASSVDHEHFSHSINSIRNSKRNVKTWPGMTVFYIQISFNTNLKV